MNIAESMDFHVSSEKLKEVRSFSRNVFAKLNLPQDQKDELVRIRIVRKDLFDFGEKIFKGHAYRKLYHDSWNKDKIIPFLNKGLLSSRISSDPMSVSRMLFIINVISWHMKKTNIEKAIFIEYLYS